MLRYLLRRSFSGLLALTGSVLNSPRLKGTAGEFLVNTTAELALPKEDYRLFKDVTWPAGEGTTQIDHIVVSPYGVFVIETKNMQGWIFGSTRQKTWTQTLYRQTHKFQNPLRQNYRHVKALEALLDIPSSAIHSLVVFVGNSTFKTAMPDNVVHASRYIRYIKGRRERLLSQVQVETVIGRIEQLRLPRGMATNRQHVRDLRARKYRAASSVPKCPRCGADMVLRTVRTGQNAGNRFWGCTGFPRCRGIVEIR